MPILAHISHRYCREIAQMGMDTRKATEETGDVLLVRWRYPTEPDAVGMPISAIAANICEKCGLGGNIFFKNKSYGTVVDRVNVHHGAKDPRGHRHGSGQQPVEPGIKLLGPAGFLGI
jgi:hypothetical protein